MNLTALHRYAMVHEELESTKDQLERGFVAGWERSAATNTDHLAKIYRKLHTLNEGLAAVFEEVDVLITPALPTVAFDAAGPMPRGAGGKTFSSPMHAVGAMYPFNFSGHPAAVLRCPGDLTADEGLPPGSIQLVAERHRDDLILQVAAIFEASCPPLIWPEVVQVPVVPHADEGSARL